MEDSSTLAYQVSRSIKSSDRADDRTSPTRKRSPPYAPLTQHTSGSQSRNLLSRQPDLFSDPAGSLPYLINPPHPPPSVPSSSSHPNKRKRENPKNQHASPPHGSFHSTPLHFPPLETQFKTIHHRTKEPKNQHPTQDLAPRAPPSYSTRKQVKLRRRTRNIFKKPYSISQQTNPSFKGQSRRGSFKRIQRRKETVQEKPNPASSRGGNGPTDDDI